MNWNLLHFIEGSRAVFNGENLTILPLSQKQYNLLSQYQMTVNKSDVSAVTKNTVSSFEKYMDGISIMGNNDTKTGYVNRIMLCVSNDCNLRCKYCYATGGNYGVERGFMTKETADNFISFCKRNFRTIDKIVFFGGEPLLNFKIIDYICSRFEKEKFETEPEFGIITNGTIISDKILSVIKRHIKFITVSIDGPANINDKNRVFENGTGSFSRIINFISKIREFTDINLQYEATFTKEHILSGYDYESLSKSLNDLTGISGTIVTENNLEGEYLFKYLRKINKENMLSAKFKNLPPDFWTVFNAIIHRRKEELCGAGKDSFSVTYDGKIYPCHIINNKAKCLMQNITDIIDFSKNAYYKTNFEKNEQCVNCWAKNICGSCPIVRFYDSDKEELCSEPQKKYCNISLKLLEVILGLIVTIRTDNELWSNIKQI